MKILTKTDFVAHWVSLTEFVEDLRDLRELRIDSYHRYDYFHGLATDFIFHSRKFCMLYDLVFPDYLLDFDLADLMAQARALRIRQYLEDGLGDRG